MVMIDPRTKYSNLVDSKIKEYRWNFSSHVRDVMVSLLMTRDKVWVGGGGVQSILSNDLYRATIYCDDDVIKHLKELVIARDYFHL